MLFEPFSKGSGRFSYMFFSTPLFFALISIYDSTLAVYRIFVLGSHKQVFDCLSSFKVNLHPIFAACFLYSFTEALMVWHYHEQVLIVGVTWALLIVCSSVFCSVRVLTFQLCSVYGPDGSGVIYRYQCKEHGCGEEHIGESARTFAERFKEHQKPPSPIFDHCNTSGHQININKFTIVGREDQSLMRAIKEAILIRVNDPSLNRNIGKYHLAHIWDEVLHKTSELKLKH